jgi:hypothetical protein
MGSFKREFIINVPRPRNLNNPILKNTVFEALDELRKDYYDKREYANPIPA